MGSINLKSFDNKLKNETYSFEFEGRTIPGALSAQDPEAGIFNCVGSKHVTERERTLFDGIGGEKDGKFDIKDLEPFDKDGNGTIEGAEYEALLAVIDPIKAAEKARHDAKEAAKGGEAPAAHAPASAAAPAPAAAPEAGAPMANAEDDPNTIKLEDPTAKSVEQLVNDIAKFTAQLTQLQTEINNLKANNPQAGAAALNQKANAEPGNNQQLQELIQQMMIVKLNLLTHQQELQMKKQQGMANKNPNMLPETLGLLGMNMNTQPTSTLGPVPQPVSIFG